MQPEKDIAVRVAVAEAGERAARTRAIIDEYQSDESSTRRAARVSLAVALVAAAGMTVDGVTAAIAIGSSDRPLGPYLIVASGLLFVAVVAGWRGLRLENTAGSLARVRRQLSVVDTQASALPADVATVVRAVATPRLLTEAATIEPWNEPTWPDTASVTKILQSSGSESPPS